jgi:multidrug resistance efflux pump
MKEKQIQELQAAIEKEKEQLKAMEGNINEAKGKVEDTAIKFQYAYDIVSKQIIDDVKNITQYSK